MHGCECWIGSIKTPTESFCTVSLILHRCHGRIVSLRQKCSVVGHSALRRATPDAEI